MGAKSRLIPGFLERVLAEEMRRGDTFLDLMSGSGVVSAFAARRQRVVANDVQQYSEVIARSLIEHSPRTRDAFLAALDPERDLESVYRRNSAALADASGPELREEEALLLEFAASGGGGDWTARYRAYLERFAPLAPGAPAPAAPLSAGAARLLAPRELERRRRDPRARPACLAFAYYANVYFGLRQSIEIDSLRAAIDELDSGSPFWSQKRAHYLSALLHAASVSTSGTSHFAQPRHLTKDSELRAMAKRRVIDIRAVFADYCRSIAESVRATAFREGNRVLTGDYRRLIGPEGSFAVGVPVDLVYLDPPYTADNYSRFYHVLEVLARYDYPPLERGPAGGILRGRYPELSERFQSDFCRPARVEGEFRRVIDAAARSGAKLVISYAAPTGLLLKTYLRQGVSEPLRRFRELCRKRYRNVEVLRRPLMHSGQGDSNLSIDELLAVCTGPLGRAQGAASRARRHRLHSRSRAW
jgi:adenine-specific DNA methylase